MKHGATNTQVYRVWSGAKSRCHNPKNPNWKNYGGRGIYMCEEWRRDFRTFHAAVGDPPDDAPRFWQLDRIDNDGPYAPGNVRWVDAVTNSNNRRQKPKGSRKWFGLGMFESEHEELKAIASEQGIHVAKLLEQICREWLEDDRKRKGTK